MENISTAGLVVIVQASRTFPAGFAVTEFADDNDPLDIPNIDISDSAMGINGDMVVWATPAPLELTLSVLPNTEGDRNLELLAEANRVAKGKLSVQDKISLTFFYPGINKRVTFNNGHLKNVPAGTSASSSGRIKTKTYSFRFENRTV